MIISGSIKEENEQVFVELKDKIRIEISFENDVDRFFDIVTEAYSLELTGKSLKKKIIDIEFLFKEQLESLLERNYQSAINQSIEYLKNDKVVSSFVSKQELEFKIREIKKQMQDYVNKRKVSSSSQILQTTKNDFIKSQIKIEKLIRENALKLTKAEKDSLIMDNFNQRLNNRSSTISVTETQNVLQTTKQKSILSIVDNVERQGKKAQKRWTALLDSETRSAHAAAHGQLQPVDGFFIVDGELLEYPGDSSHGASMANLMNCRCSYFMTVLS